MKKRISFMVAAAAMLILTGCRNQAEEPEELVKGQAMLIDAAQNGSENSSGFPLELPEKFTGDWIGADGCVVVHADAGISLPDTEAIPTAIVERKVFSQADADKLLEVFLKGNTLYQEQGMTKQRAQELLEHYQAIERGDIPYEHDGSIERVPGLIASYEELVKTAPDESERFLAPTTFQTGDEWNEGRIKGCAEVDGKVVHVTIYNSSFVPSQACFYLDGYGDVNTCNFSEAEEGISPGVMRADAIEMGNALMKELGNGSFVCSQIRPVVYFSNARTEDEGIFDSGFEMEFVRTVGSFPIAHCPRYEITPEGNSWMIPSFMGTATPENETNAETWGYERVRIYVNNEGVVYFSWQNPYREPEVKTADTKLLNFADISDIFAKMIMVKNSDLMVINAKNGFKVIREIDIDEVALNLMRVRSKDNFEEGLLVPVWDFWGTIHLSVEEEAYRDIVYDGKYYSVQLTVNAIDGTIIDREFGY